MRFGWTGLSVVAVVVLALARLWPLVPLAAVALALNIWIFTRALLPARRR